MHLFGDMPEKWLTVGVPKSGKELRSTQIGRTPNLTHQATRAKERRGQECSESKRQ